MLSIVAISVLYFMAASLPPRSSIVLMILNDRDIRGPFLKDSLAAHVPRSM
jgi:hypothetical protein